MEKTLTEQLAELKTSIEAKLSEKTSKEIADQLETIKSQMAEIEAKSATAKDAEIAELTATVTSLKADLDATVKGLEIVNARVKGAKIHNVEPAKKSFNSLLTEGIQENFDEIRKLSKGGKVSFDLKSVADMTFATNFSTADTSVAFNRPGIIELPKRKLHIRELLQGGGMGDKSTFDYVKEVAGEEGPETVAEGSAKNQFDLDLQEVSVPAQYIAGYIRISRKMLDDVTGMTTFLNSRLLELLLREEDDQLINGDGTSPNISGITDTGNFTAPASPYTATVDVEQLVQAIAQLESYDREANGILLSPADYWNIALTKGATSGDYSLPPGIVVVGEDGILRIGGVPVYRSTAMAADKYIVGDWVMGANLITREPARVEFFVQDGTNVRENKVTVRVEERIAFPIYGDNYFIYGDFGNVS